MYEIWTDHTSVDVDRSYFMYNNLSGDGLSFTTIRLNTWLSILFFFFFFYNLREFWTCFILLLAKQSAKFFTFLLFIVLENPSPNYRVMIIKYDNIVYRWNAQGVVLTEGSYQDLRESDLDFTKLLGSSAGTVVESENESNNAATAGKTNARPPVPPFERQISCQSALSSVDEYKFNSVQEKPVVEAETRTYGSVSSNVYMTYFSAGGSAVKIFVFVFMCILTQVLASGGDFWMTYWYFGRRFGLYFLSL